MERTNPRRIACEWWRWEGIAPKLGFREGIEPFVELDAQLMVAIKSGTVAYSLHYEANFTRGIPALQRALSNGSRPDRSGK